VHGAGTIIDEVWADPALNTAPVRARQDPNDWGDYSFFGQRIRWDADGNCSIRLGYCRRAAGSVVWRFGSQMTINADWQTIKALFISALARTSWFQDEPFSPQKDA